MLCAVDFVRHIYLPLCAIVCCRECEKGVEAALRRRALGLDELLDARPDAVFVKVILLAHKPNDAFLVRHGPLELKVRQKQSAVTSDKNNQP